MTKEQILGQLRNDVYCRLRQSSIQGVGVFAIIDIPKGANPFVGCYDGDWIEITKDELSKANIPIAVMDVVNDLCVKEGDIYYFPDNGINGVDMSWFLNHSKHPNMEEIDGGEDFMASRDIKAGEELTIDYSTYGDVNIEGVIE